jgi:hypothetical protein
LPGERRAAGSRSGAPSSSALLGLTAEHLGCCVCAESGRHALAYFAGGRDSPTRCTGLPLVIGRFWRNC